MGAGAAKQLQNEKAQHAAALLTAVQAFEEDETGFLHDDNLGELELFKRRIIRATENSKKRGTDVSEALAQLDDSDIAALSHYYTESHIDINKSPPKSKSITGSPGLKIEEIIDDDSPKRREHMGNYSDDDFEIQDVEILKPILAVPHRNLVSPIKIEPVCLEVQSLESTGEVVQTARKVKEDLSDDERDNVPIVKIYPSDAAVRDKQNALTSSAAANSPINRKALETLVSRGQLLAHSNSSTSPTQRGERMKEEDIEKGKEPQSSMGGFKVVETLSISSPATKKYIPSKIPSLQTSGVAVDASVASNGSLCSPAGFYPGPGEAIDMHSEKMMHLQRTKVVRTFPCMYCVYSVYCMHCIPRVY